jgi:tetratricopeptide (TPR) repeat protein
MNRALRAVLGILAVAAFVTAGLGQSTSSQTSSASKRAEAYFHFTKARMLDEQGQWTEAIQEYQKALEMDPNNSLIHSEMADTYYRNRRGREAIEAAEKAVQADRNNIEAHKILSTIYTAMLGNGNNQQPPPADTLNKAVREFEEIIRIDPAETQAYMMLGQLYQIRNEPDKAADVYKKYLGMEPGSEQGLVALAKLQIDAGNDQEAVALLQKFVAERPDSNTAHETLGQAYTNLQQFKEAAEAYRKALELDADNLELKKSRAQALFFSDQLNESAVLYQELLRAEPDDGIALLRLGQIYRRQMKYALARQYMEKAIAMFADSVEVQFNFVLLERDEGRLQDAVVRIAGILKTGEKPNGRYSEGEQQNRRIFLTNLALLNTTIGRYDDAVQAFTDLKAISPDKDRVDSFIVDTYRTAKRRDKALEYCEQALRSAPESRELQLVHADLIAEKGRVDEGIRNLQKLTRGNEDDLAVFSTMTSIYERARKWDQAQDVVDTAIRRFPTSESVYLLQGSLYEQQKKYNDAERAFRKALEIEKDSPAVLNYLGYILADRGVKLQEAVEMLHKAVESDPTNGAYLDSLGWAYFRLNQLDRAEEYMRRALIFAGNNPTIRDHMGDLYYKTMRYEEARVEWTKSLEVGDDNEEIERVKKKLDGLKTRIANR